MLWYPSVRTLQEDRKTVFSNASKGVWICEQKGEEPGNRREKLTVFTLLFDLKRDLEQRWDLHFCLQKTEDHRL